MKILVEFDVPESWDHYTEEQNLRCFTNWGATNDGVTAKVVTDEQIKKVPEMIETLKGISEAFNRQDIIVREDSGWEDYEKIESLLKELEV